MRARSLGIVTLAAATALASGCGGSDSQKSSVGPNAKHYKGEQRAVAQVVDDLVAAARAHDPKRICTEVFTSALADAIGKRGGTSCEVAVTKQLITGKEAIVVTAVTVKGSEATAAVKETGGKDTRLGFLKLNGQWQINAIR